MDRNKLTPEDAALHRHLHIIVVDIFALLADAKVGDFASSSHVDQDIVSFEITVKNATFMQICKSGQNLTSEVLDQAFFKATTGGQVVFANTSTDAPTRNLRKNEVSFGASRTERRPLTYSRKMERYSGDSL